jgi:geranylgeranyl diphosphate synthase, type II
MLTDKEILKLINDAIEADPFNGSPGELYEPLDYILALGGKRIRPVLLLLTADMYSGDLQKALPAALGIELFHNFSLIHDDIMDNAPIRRGKPTVHIKWNPNTAILSGDTMLVKAYEKFLKLPDQYLRPALDIFNQTALEVCEGQQFDMNFETQGTVKIAEYLEMIRLKTAVLIGASLYLGGLLADAPENDLRNLYNFGIHIGLVFQLRDDLLDTYGDEKAFGKKNYGDIAANKKTFLYLKALENAEDEDRKRLSTLFSSDMVDPEEKILSTLGFFEKTGVKQATEDEIKKHQKLAQEYFDHLMVVPDRKKIMWEYTEILAGRTT